MCVVSQGDTPATFLESALESPRLATVVLLMLVPAVSWAWIVVMARDMYGPMTGASRWMMTPQWDWPHVLLLWAMWAVMMIGMMLPSAAPMILLYGAAARRRHAVDATTSTYALAAGYVAIWALFSIVATAAQRVLGARLLMSPMMELTNPQVGGAMLAVAGVYQLTPLKHACLRVCQSPLGFLLGHAYGGVPGAFRIGIEHGLYCLGCCWALMLLLFVGGIMNLVVICALTAFVAFEKLGVLGRFGTHVSGALLVATGAWMLMR